MSAETSATDRQLLEDLFTRRGIKFKTEGALTFAPDDKRWDNVAVSLQVSGEQENVYGFTAEFFFNEKGDLLKVGIWE